jgi:hypothetical protein
MYTPMTFRVRLSLSARYAEISCADASGLGTSMMKYAPASMSRTKTMRSAEPSD